MNSNAHWKYYTTLESDESGGGIRKRAGGRGHSRRLTSSHSTTEYVTTSLQPQTDPPELDTSYSALSCVLLHIQCIYTCSVNMLKVTLSQRVVAVVRRMVLHSLTHKTLVHVQACILSSPNFAGCSCACLVLFTGGGSVQVCALYSPKFVACFQHYMYIAVHVLSPSQVAELVAVLLLPGEDVGEAPLE